MCIPTGYSRIFVEFFTRIFCRVICFCLAVWRLGVNSVWEHAIFLLFFSLCTINAERIELNESFTSCIGCDGKGNGGGGAFMGTHAYLVTLTDIFTWPVMSSRGYSLCVPVLILLLACVVAHDGPRSRTLPLWRSTIGVAEDATAVVWGTS